MIVVREKKFNSFIEGKNEVLDLIPIYTLLYMELNNISSIEELNKLSSNNDELNLSIREENNTYIFKLRFLSDQYMYLNRSMNFKNWEVVYDECEGLSTRDINMIYNN